MDTSALVHDLYAPTTPSSSHTCAPSQRCCIAFERLLARDPTLAARSEPQWRVGTMITRRLSRCELV